MLLCPVVELFKKCHCSSLLPTIEKGAVVSRERRSNVVKMLLCIFLPVFSFLLYSQGSFAQSSPHYEAIQRLHAELLKNYNKQTIPQTERAKPLDITTGFTLETFDFNEHKAIFSAKGFFRLSWKDPRLSWKPENYDGVESVHIPGESIWVPDLEVYNLPGKLGKERIFAHSIALVSSDGSVIYVPFNSFDAICPPDPAKYPNDELACKVIVGSWTHSTRKIKLFTADNATEVITEYFTQTEVPGWKLLSTNIVSKEKTYDCCPNDLYQSLEYTFAIQRRAPSAVFAVTIPAILVSLLTLGSLLIPVPASSRLIVGMISLLITCSYLLFFHAYFAAAGSTPLIVQYLCALAILVTLSILQAALGIRFISCCESASAGSKNFLKRLLSKDSRLLASSNGAKIEKNTDNDDFHRGEDSKVSWLTVLLAVDRWIFIVYTIIFAALIKAYLI